MMCFQIKILGVIFCTNDCLIVKPQFRSFIDEWYNLKKMAKEQGSKNGRREYTNSSN